MSSPTLVRGIVKITIGIVGSVIIGYVIKGEKLVEKKIEARWPIDSSTTQS